MLLDYGFRSKCCYKPIRMSDKKLKSGIKIKVWVCTACKKKDCEIIPYTGVERPHNSETFALDTDEPPDFEEV